MAGLSDDHVSVQQCKCDMYPGLSPAVEPNEGAHKRLAAVHVVSGLLDTRGEPRGPSSTPEKKTGEPCHTGIPRLRLSAPPFPPENTQSGRISNGPSPTFRTDGPKEKKKGGLDLPREVEARELIWWYLTFSSVSRVRPELCRSCASTMF